MTVQSLTHISAGFLEKSIPVARLKEILSQLEDTDLLYPNRVGNLSVVRGDQQIGYVDIGSESLELDEKDVKD